MAWWHESRQKKCWPMARYRKKDKKSLSGKAKLSFFVNLQLPSGSHFLSHSLSRLAFSVSALNVGQLSQDTLSACNNFIPFV